MQSESTMSTMRDHRSQRYGDASVIAMFCLYFVIALACFLFAACSIWRLYVNAQKSALFARGSLQAHGLNAWCIFWGICVLLSAIPTIWCAYHSGKAFVAEFRTPCTDSHPQLRR
jgi:hypothetical protein